MKTKLCVLLAALMAGVLFTGCAFLAVGAAAGAAGAGAVAYVNGELKVTESMSLDTAYKAAEMALANLKMDIVKSDKDGLAAKMEVQATADKKATIHLRKLADKSTEVRIRVGVFGDESIARQIHAKMQANVEVAQKSK